MAAVVDLDGYMTVTAIARRLGLSYTTVCSWAVAWYGPIGSGNHRPLTLLDLFVARAWQVMGGGGHGTTDRYGRVAPRLRLVEAVIRSAPRRWLLVAGPVIETWSSAEVAAARWVQTGEPAGQIIDLWGTE